MHKFKSPNAVKRQTSRRIVMKYQKGRQVIIFVCRFYCDAFSWISEKNKQTINTNRNRRKISFSLIQRTFRSSSSSSSPSPRKIPTPFEDAIDAQLVGHELLFFKQFESKEFTSTLMNDDRQMRFYLNKIAGKSATEQREYRMKTDVRYKSHAQPELHQLDLCYENLNINGNCTGHHCTRSHQLRNPRAFGVCKYFIMGKCSRGNLCVYMHADFPCRYYYLDMQHPSDADNCRFMHGGPLPSRMASFFRTHLKHWACETSARYTVDDLLEWFEQRQQFLMEQQRTQIPPTIETKPTKDEFSLDRLLNDRQIALLAASGFTTATQINRIPIDDLLDEYRLDMDQILEISQNCGEDEDEQPPVHTDEDASIQYTKLMDAFDSRGDIGFIKPQPVADVKPIVAKPTQIPEEAPKPSNVQPKVSSFSIASILGDSIHCDQTSKLNKTCSDSDDADSSGDKLVIIEDLWS